MTNENSISQLRHALRYLLQQATTGGVQSAQSLKEDNGAVISARRVLVETKPDLLLENKEALPLYDMMTTGLSAFGIPLTVDFMAEWDGDGEAFSAKLDREGLRIRRVGGYSDSDKEFFDNLESMRQEYEL